MCVVQFYVVLFISRSSSSLGSHKRILHQETFFSLFYHYNHFYVFLTNKGHCCVYSGVFQYNYSASKTYLFGIYAMMFMGEKKDLFYFIVCVPVRKKLKPELNIYARFLGISIFHTV